MTCDSSVNQAAGSVTMTTGSRRRFEEVMQLVAVLSQPVNVTDVRLKGLKGGGGGQTLIYWFIHSLLPVQLFNDLFFPR